jgi:hypothetical protein
MSRTPRVCSGLLVAVVSGVCLPAADGQVPVSLLPTRTIEAPLLRAAHVSGRFEGTVVDEQGLPLPGAAVTAQGIQLKFAMADRQGRFVFESLPVGPYLVRVHMPGFTASKRELVDVQPARSVLRQFQLVRAAVVPVPQRPILAASLGGEQPVLDAGVEAVQPGEGVDHGDSPTAWRVRHLKRSVLRETEHAAAAVDEAPEATSAPAPWAAQFGVGASPSFSDGLPFDTRVQLLTINAFDNPVELFSGSRVPNSVAYIEVSAPMGAALWAVQGAFAQGPIASWVLGGSYVATVGQAHHVDVGMSYAAQRFDAGSPLAYIDVAEPNRTVGAFRVADRWRLTPAMDVTFATRYAHYGYLQDPGLWSPRVQWRWRAGARETLWASASQEMLAPGAEEFVPSTLGGLWMPPQRTFSALVPTQGLRAARTRQVEAGFDREVASFVLSARGFRQVTEDQLLTAFGLEVPDRMRADLGHFFAASAGDVEAFGWAVAMARPVASRIRGSVEYSLTHANWVAAPTDAIYSAFSRSAVRASQERIHDVSTSVETNIPETATRVYAVYRLNSAYSRGDSLESLPSLSGRFDVQVNQRLPFVPLGDAEWEVLVAVRNMFRDTLDGSSVYDELLVIRPPKRIVGGLVVKF